MSQIEFVALAGERPHKRADRGTAAVLVFDGLQIEFYKTLFKITGFCDDDDDDDYEGEDGHSLRRKEFHKASYSEKSKQALLDVLCVVDEAARWRTFPGMHDTNIVFAYSLQFHNWTRDSAGILDYVSIYAIYKFTQLNGKSASFRHIHHEYGTREKFCGNGRNLPKAGKFLQYFHGVEKFKIHKQYDYVPLNFLCIDGEYSYHTLRVQTERVCLTPEAATYGIAIDSAAQSILFYVAKKRENHA